MNPALDDCRGRRRPRIWPLVLVLACASPASHPPPLDAPEESAPDAAAFSSKRAWAHLEALAEIGPRVSGSRGAARARRYLREQLEGIGAQVSEVAVPIGTVESESGIEAVHVVALLPGDSTDRFMLAAAYDTPPLVDVEFDGANASASGPALVLELARALSLRPRPYTWMVVLLDGDFAPGDPWAAPERSSPGSRALARLLERDGTLARIRLAAFFQQVGDAELAIARDLRSHTVYRDAFFEAATELGYERAFPRDAAWESPLASHRVFIEAGLPRVVLITDDRYGGESRPGRHAWSEQDTTVHCAPASLAAVGEVSLSALDAIASRLVRMDRFPAETLAEPHEPASGSSASPVPAAR